jgi:hypothetical protein
VSAYVDGFNVYYGINAAGFRRYLWLDYRSLVASLLRPDQRLVSMKYFTSKVTESVDSMRRQDSRTTTSKPFALAEALRSSREGSSVGRPHVPPAVSDTSAVRRSRAK